MVLSLKTARSLKDQKEKQSYVIGVDIGKALHRQGMQIDAESLSKGIKDGISGGELLMTDQEIQETMMALQKEMRAKQEEAKKRPAKRIRRRGRRFWRKTRKRKALKPSRVACNIK